MLIDWFTVGAQTLNFLILVWLLKRFLYAPILNAIDSREKRIAAELADADARKAEAQKERDEFLKKNEAFDQQRSALLSQAIEAAQTERQRLLDAARQAADALTAKRREALREDARHLNQVLIRKTQQEVFAIVRKTLTDLASVSLEERLVDVFIRRLGEMDVAAKTVLAQALDSAEPPARVRTAFDLPEPQRKALQKALDETFPKAKPVQFEVAPDAVSGIELSAKGQRVAWSIEDYLASLEKSICELLKECDDVDASGEAVSTQSESQQQSQ